MCVVGFRSPHYSSIYSTVKCIQFKHSYIMLKSIRSARFFWVHLSFEICFSSGWWFVHPWWICENSPHLWHTITQEIERHVVEMPFRAWRCWCTALGRRVYSSSDATLFWMRRPCSEAVSSAGGAEKRSRSRLAATAHQRKCQLWVFYNIPRKVQALRKCLFWMFGSNMFAL